MRWQTSVRVVLIGLVLVAAVVAAAVIVRAQAAPAEETAAAAYAAFNAGDLDAFLALFTDDAVVTAGPFGVFTGHDEIGAWAAPQFGYNAQMEYEIVSAEGNLVTGQSIYASEEFAFPLEATEAYVIENGLITALTWTPSSETLAMIQQMQEEAALPARLAGTYSLLIEGVFPPTEEAPAALSFAMFGTMVADGNGNITSGERTLNFGGATERDSVDGVYIVSPNGTFSLTLDGYQKGKRVAVEEFVCALTADGSRFDCIVTTIARVDLGPEPVAFPVVATAHGMSLTP